MRTRCATLVALLAALVLVVGCGSSAESTSSSDGKPWSFTDGSGETVTVDHTPTRIIAHAYAAAALMSFGITPIAVYGDADLASDPGTANTDFSGIDVLGETWGEIDVEKAAELQPDLIVGDWWPVEEAHSGFEDGVKEESKKLADLAPVVGPSQGDSIVTLIEGYAKLAESLGADVSNVSAQRARFDEAVATFTAVVAAKPGLTALAVSPNGSEGLAIAVPQHAPELLDFQRFGLDVLTPDHPDESFPYWETVSWENVDKYQADILLIDDRTYPANLDEAKTHPTWVALKAAAAGAVVPWPAYWLHTYSDYADQLEQLTVAVNTADPALVG